MTARDLLRRIWPAGAFGRNASGWQSAVSHPDLIHPEATVTNSTISGKVHVGRGSIIKDSFILARELHIGRNTSLWGPNIDIHCILNPVRIGSFCSIAHDVSIQEYNHRMDRCSTYFFSSNVFHEGMEQDIASRGPVVIGSDVWIASRVVVGSGVTIGDGAVIGANSVVLEEVPPYAVVAGSPAKLLRYRFDEGVVARLRALKWWDWDDNRISKNRELFLEPLTAAVLDRIV